VIIFLAVQNIAAILLAAGRSQRMGAFKPLLPFGNKSVIETCIDNLKSAGVDQIVVVVGHRAAEVRQHLNHHKVSFALNPRPESEMSASIACGIQKVPTSTKAALIALVDHPAVSVEVITALIEKWKAGARLIIPQFDGRGGHPVLIDLSLREELLRVDPTRGLRALFEAHQSEVSRLPVPSPFVARDMDTWEDYIRLHTEFFGKPPAIKPSSQG
jgi:molybdenum cofactor cytidylyltransferase